jgi:hypothetical protein
MSGRSASSGYSGTPLPKKLGFKEGMRASIVGAPRGFRGRLEPLPAGIEFVRDGGSELDLVMLFVTDGRTLTQGFREWTARLTPAGMLWVAWPKKTSGVATDLTENVARDIGLVAGLVDVKVCAIDETWSGLKFVRRLRDR